MNALPKSPVRCRFLILTMALLTAMTTVPRAAEVRVLTPDKAVEHLGERATVCGKVVSAKYANSSKGQPTFLNLDRPYPNQVFTVVIWGDDRAAFGEPEKTYADRRICVTGTIEAYRRKAEIIARTPSQIVLQETPAGAGHR